MCHNVENRCPRASPIRQY